MIESLFAKYSRYVTVDTAFIQLMLHSRMKPLRCRQMLLPSNQIRINNYRDLYESVEKYIDIFGSCHLRNQTLDLRPSFQEFRLHRTYRLSSHLPSQF